MGPFLIVAVLVLLFVAASLWQRQRRLQREGYIRHFELPRGLFDKLMKRRPGLTLKDCQLTAHALRQFFLAHLQSGRGFVSMPSQVADDLWHEFILYTRHYELFCRKAFGRFLHHTPAVVLGGGAKQANAGLRRVWWFVCREENIDPRKPSRLPLLFALDAKFGVADGFRYVPDCRGVRREGESGAGASYCGGDFASDGIDGSTDGFGDASSSSSDGGSSDGGGDGGGCSGGGCSS